MRQPYGQNFLTDKDVAARIVEAACLAEADTVLEIGPGKGALTKFIAPLVSKVIAVELDRNFAAALSRNFSGKPNVEVVNSDFLAFPLPTSDFPLTIVSNLPYSAATAIIEKFLPWKNWSSAVVMVQKEVGDRIAAGPDNRDYGVLSILTQYYASVEVLFKVGPESFFPAPKVESSVLLLKNLLPPPLPEGFAAVVKAAFHQRRKTVLNSISAGLKLPKSDVSKLLLSCDINPGLRPENLTQKDYLCLTKTIESSIIR